MGEVCMRALVPTTLAVLLCSFVGFLEEFLARLRLRLYLLWSLFQIAAGLVKEGSSASVTTMHILCPVLLKGGLGAIDSVLPFVLKDFQTWVSLRLLY